MNFQVLLALYIQSGSTLEHGQGRCPCGNSIGSASFPSYRDQLFLDLVRVQLRLAAPLSNLANSFGQFHHSQHNGGPSLQDLFFILFLQEWAVAILPHPAVDVNMPKEVRRLYLF